MWYTSARSWPASTSANSNGCFQRTITATLTLLCFFSGDGWAVEPVTQSEDRGLTVRVVHKVSGEPLGGVLIQNVATDGARSPLGRSSEQGLVKSDLEREPAGAFTVAAYKPGFVPIRISWTDLGETPAVCTLKLEPAVMIGGVIQDEKGQALSGAEVRVSAFSDSYQAFDTKHHPVRSGTDGRWRCALLPRDINHAIVSIVHPAFTSGELWPGDRGGTTLQDLRDQKAVCTLKPGVKIEGRTLDTDGRPVAGASVLTGYYRQKDDASDIVRSDARGHFETRPQPLGDISLTIESVGHAPEMVKVCVAAGMKPLECRLAPRNRLHGRVADSADRPVKGAAIEAWEWRERYTLGWQTVTDADGRFAWESAPEDDVTLLITHSDFRREQIKLRASAEAHRVTLQPALRIRGHVIDAQTRKPIPEFEIVLGTCSGENAAPDWHQPWRRFEGGDYKGTIMWGGPRHAIAIQADRYEPAISKTFDDTQGEFVFDAQMKTGNGPSGVVQRNDGSVAQGATVMLCSPSHHARIHNGLPRQFLRDRLSAETDREGRFALPFPLEPSWIVVLHRDGFAELSSERVTWDVPIRLTPWGRIEGIVQVASRPAPDHTVELWPGAEPAGAPNAHWNYAATPDAGDGVRFDRVKPGYVGAGLSARAGIRSICVADWVRAGETTQMRLGGSGLSVTGRVRAGAETGAASWEFSSGVMEAIKPSGGFVEALINTFRDEADTRTSEPGQPYYFGFTLASDGTFRIDDLVPGTYRLAIDVYEPSDKTSGRRGSRIGSVTHRFRMPAAGQQTTTAPFDLGQLRLNPCKRLIKGQPAPDFAVTTLDGQPLRLRDFRGRFVLLDFWATWCSPCIAEFPKLHEIHHEFEKDRRLSIVSLSLDTEIADVKRFIEKNKTPWKQGFLGEWGRSEVARDYSVEGIPAYFLIDPQGRLLSKGLRGDALRAAVTEALANPASAPSSRPQEP